LHLLKIEVLDTGTCDTIEILKWHYKIESCLYSSTHFSLKFDSRVSNIKMTSVTVRQIVKGDMDY